MLSLGDQASFLEIELIFFCHAMDFWGFYHFGKGLSVFRRNQRVINIELSFSTGIAIVNRSVATFL